MKRAVYPGSFDPVTKGHLDIIERAAAIVDELIVGVLNNNEKTPLFSVEERVKMLKDVTVHIPNVRIESFSGLSVEFVKKCGAAFWCAACVRLQILSMSFRWRRRTGALTGKWIHCFLRLNLNTHTSVPRSSKRSHITEGIYQVLSHRRLCSAFVRKFHRKPGEIQARYK